MTLLPVSLMGSCGENKYHHHYILVVFVQISVDFLSVASATIYFRYAFLPLPKQRKTYFQSKIHPKILYK